MTKPTFKQREQAARKAFAHQSRSDAITKRFADVAGDHAATWRVTRDVLHRGKQLYTLATPIDVHWWTISASFLRQGAPDTEFHRQLDYRPAYNISLVDYPESISSMHPC